MMMDLAKINIILASKSPRRKELLEGLGVKFELRTKDTDESFSASLNPEEVAGYLSEKKAKAFSEELKSGELIIASDTIVVLDKEILGKPLDHSEAVQMLQKLSGKMHQVYTAFTLMDENKMQTITDMTKVFFKDLSNEEIDHYVRKYQPFDKAGAYGIQEWIGFIAVEKIEGSYFTVMGLPVHLIYDSLKNW
jgi:septum formation protein